jgi:S-(hydroxymethyl)glutathione dehydrogenase/alcohol dehydrogenase
MTRPRTAEAAVLEKVGEPLKIFEIDLPPLKEGQVLVKILCSGVCRSQLMEVSGGRGEDKWLPHLLGHEGSGEVLEVGQGVTKVQPGSEVILSWIKSSGIEAKPAIYEIGSRKINSGPITTFSNYSIVSENRLIPKPVAIPHQHAMLFGCALTTGMGMVINEGKPRKEDIVAIVGLGGIGLAALLATSSLGVEKIICIDQSSDKLNLAKQLGADVVIDATKVDPQGEIFKATSGCGVDVCFESAGSVQTIELGFDIIKKGGGALFFASHPNDDKKISISPHDLISGKNIKGSWGGASKPDRDVPRFSNLLRSSAPDLDLLIPLTYKLSEVNEALETIRTGTAFRPLIEMTH